MRLLLLCLAYAGESRGSPAGSPLRAPGRSQQSWLASQAIPAEAMEIAQGDMHQPDLRIGNTLTQPADRLHLILVKLVFARLDVDGDELVLVSGRQSGANLALDERVPAAGKLFFAVAALGSGHGHSPFSGDR